MKKEPGICTRRRCELPKLPGRPLCQFHDELTDEEAARRLGVDVAEYVGQIKPRLDLGPQQPTPVAQIERWRWMVREGVIR